LGHVDGVTTNPSLIAKKKRPFRPVVEEICLIVPGDVSLEVVARYPGPSGQRQGSHAMMG